MRVPSLEELLEPRAVGTQEETDTSTVTSLARPWKVIVHDDPVTLMSYVVKVFVEVFAYSKTKAHALMMEVHNTGRSVVWTGAREQAETYVHKLQTRHLLATLEEDDD
jgi:ATP-dependent Clp protease adaptor protein ClpS